MKEIECKNVVLKLLRNNKTVVQKPMKPTRII